MLNKPTTASAYSPDQVGRVKATCLYLATKLGDLMPELVVVGGLVPSLLVDHENLPKNIPPHVGTMDLDLGLAFALVGEARYQEVAARLRNAKFSPDETEEGKPTRQRWRISEPPSHCRFPDRAGKNLRSAGGPVVRPDKRLGGDHCAGLASRVPEQQDCEARWTNHHGGNG